MTAGGRTETLLLEPAEVERFERDGFIVFDPAVAEEVIDGIRSDMEDLYVFEGERFRNDRGVTFWEGSRPRIMDSWKIVDNPRALALAPRVMAITEQLFGRKPLPFQTLNFMLGTEQSPHMDSWAFYSDPPDQMCGVWVALEDMDMDNGPLVYYPGSHKVGQPRPFEQVASELGEPYVAREDYPDHDSFTGDRQKQWMAYAAKLIEDHGLEPQYGTIKKGQALLWAPNLIHGGSPQRDKQRTRHSQVTHYFFEGCRHYSPMRTERDHIFWDYKVWVREPPPQYSTAAVHEAITEKVPSGATIAVATAVAEDGVLSLPGFDVRRFPGEQDDGPSAVAELERLQSSGVSSVVFPQPLLWWLENQVPELQGRLESSHRALLRDGGICAIYALD